MAAGHERALAACAASRAGKSFAKGSRCRPSILDWLAEHCASREMGRRARLHIHTVRRTYTNGDEETPFKVHGDRGSETESLLNATS